MPQDARQNQFRLGFLTAVNLSERGFVGGLLVTNHFGRPLEFQCTTPVKPNRTQEILYGPTLLPFLLGELIGGTLVDKVQVKPDLLLTEQPEFLELLNHVDLPVACLSSDEDAAPQAAGPNPNPQQQVVADPTRDLNSISIGRQLLRIHAAHPGIRSVVEQKGHLVPRDADLREPFQRVRDALDETLNVRTS